MDPSYHRGRQSFDTGRGVSFDRLDSQAEWRQQSTVPAITPHVWTPQLGEARRLQQQQHYRQPSGFTDYPSEPPSPAQSNMSNSWAAQTVPPKYAYYLDRGNGYVTRLIPADALPNLNEIPPQELRGLGMEILQPLRGSPPNGAPNMDQKVTVQVQTPLPFSSSCLCDGTEDPEADIGGDGPILLERWTYLEEGKNIL